MNDSSGTTVALFLVCCVGYFLPSIVAWSRRVNARGGLYVLNLFLGWTVLGWIAALIWAASGQTEAEARSKVIDYARLAATMGSAQYPTVPAAMPVERASVAGDSASLRLGRTLGSLRRKF